MCHFLGTLLLPLDDKSGILSALLSANVGGLAFLVCASLSGLPASLSLHPCMLKHRGSL